MKNKMIFYAALLVVPYMTFGMYEERADNQLKIMMPKNGSFASYSVTFQHVSEIKTKKAYPGRIHTWQISTGQYDSFSLVADIKNHKHECEFFAGNNSSVEAVLQQFKAQYDNKKYADDEQIVLLLQEEKVENGQWLSFLLEHRNVKSIINNVPTIEPQEPLCGSCSNIVKKIAKTDSPINYRKRRLFFGIGIALIVAYYFDLLQIKQLMLNR